jgi:hypothetical protein
MAIKVNWKTLLEIKEELATTKNLTADTSVIFVLLLKDGTHQKKTIKFKDFLKFFWFMYDSTKFYVKGLVVTDLNGNILYRQQQAQIQNALPSSGNTHIFTRWNSLNEEQKDAFISILLAQIYDYTLRNVNNG